MRCEQPKTRPEVPEWISRIYQNAVVRKARTTHYCSGPHHRCHMEIGPGDYYVQPGPLEYGIPEVWCMDCVGIRTEPAARCRINKRRIRSKR